MEYKISVIIPYFRSHETIERTIKSINNQTIDVYEIIIIDDNSNTYEDNKILDSLKNKSNLKIIKSDVNRGPSYCRNLGIDEAKGDFIAFQDSDDAWHPQKLEIQIKIMEKYGFYLSGHGSEILKSENEIPSSHLFSEDIIVKKIGKFQQLFKNRFPTRSVMIKNDKNFKFDVDLRRAEDYLMWTNILFNNKTAGFIDKNLAYSFKEHYGDSGLTKNLFKMYKGGIHACFKLYKLKKINLILFFVLFILRSIKYLMRELLLFVRK
ncbi:glycosyltransferase family 2 protein [Macrococcoides caseolyticum]|uniref:glycosyltransferase family 2 protein n=1 Tax=Macrococcoides caseolyticum TaxID=69966 RepID=UPI0012FED457|nr:glycosyltransferase family 2 protein [Macrococcus caseolyticus]